MATAQIVTKSLGYLINILPQGFEHIESFKIKFQSCITCNKNKGAELLAFI